MNKELIDITSGNNELAEMALKQVGLSAVRIPFILADSIEDTKKTERVIATVSAYVSLDVTSARGIHMSRLYNSIHNYFDSMPMSLSLLNRLTEEMAKGQAGISTTSYLDVSFELVSQRKSLKSNLVGWRSYPVKISCSYDLNGNFCCSTEVRVTYSSTCPCSAALARQLNAEKANSYFQSENISKHELLTYLLNEQSTGGLPHAQRSEASVLIKNRTFLSKMELMEIIDEVEAALGTAVQTTVKREDEQEFARLNARNLMFCEDAARRIAKRLEGIGVRDNFRVEALHRESLHPFDVQAVIERP
jgi:GTP cyclohydrolase I